MLLRVQGMEIDGLGFRDLRFQDLGCVLGGGGGGFRV